MFRLSSLTKADGERLREELGRQYRILRGEALVRIALVGLAYAVCAQFVSAWLMALLFLVEVVGEVVSQRLLKGLDPVRSPTRYRLYLLSLVPMEAGLITAAGSVWMQDDPYAKSIAVGMVMGALLHLCSVRSIHLLLGIVGMTTVAVVTAAFNTVYWIQEGSWLGFAVSTLIAAAAIGYAATVMVSNHWLHRAGAEAATAAKAASVAKGRFLAQISHELRTPLNAVIGLVEIEAANAVGTSRQRLRTVATSARDLAVMLDDAVDYSALTEGRVAVTPRPVALRPELSASLLVFELQARNQGRTLNVGIERDVPAVVMVDSQRVRQCLGNLIANALKHTSRGPVTVSVRYQRGRLVIDVADQGKGIPTDLQERVFEPFFRGKGEAPGVGLGLAISRAVARQMGGDLVLVPAAQGTIFRLTISAPEAEAAADAQGATNFRDKVILVVDDIATNRLVASQLLSAAGARTVEAASGPEALARLDQGGIDAVLLDLMMPGMDGQETLFRIRETHGRKVRVVAMTADVLSIRRDDTLRERLDGFLPKPILPETLREVLAQVLTR